jgi:hypothetical protein
MKVNRGLGSRSLRWLLLLLFPLASACAYAQSCFMANDMEPATRTALESTGKRYFDMAAKGAAASLQQNAIPSLASNFSGVQTALKDNQAVLSQAQARPRPPFLLKAEGTAPLAHAEFLCGVFGKEGQTANSSEFAIPNLPPGNYGIVISDLTSPKGKYTLTFVLQQAGNDWKLGGFYLKPAEISGHDGNWFAQQARSYKAKGETHNAWFYFLEARELLAPVSFMYTQTTDKLYDEMQAVKPSDLPATNLVSGGKTFKVLDVFPVPVGNDLDLVVKYQSADISNTAQTFQDNMAVMKALVAKYPEFREAFAGIVARAVESSGRDYGSLMAMKDIK